MGETGLGRGEIEHGIGNVVRLADLAERFQRVFDLPARIETLQVVRYVAHVVEFGFLERVIELAPEITVDEVRERSEAKFEVAPGLN